MDNGWEILPPEEEARRQKRELVIWQVIKFVFFPSLIIAMFCGLSRLAEVLKHMQ